MRAQVEGSVGALQARILHDDRKPLARWLSSQASYADEEAELLLRSSSRSLRAQDRIRRMIVVAPWLVPLHFLVVRGGIRGWLAGDLLRHAAGRGREHSRAAAPGAAVHTRAPMNRGREAEPRLNGRALRILAVSPRFAPTNGADTHRLRLVVNHASSAGWNVEVLCVEPSLEIGPTDPWLADGLPSDVPVHRVRSLPLTGWGLRGLSQRSIWPLYRRGSELLATGRFDLVFFSTTEFAVHLLGPVWRRRFGIPFCMDYQDPWVNDFYRRNPDVVPPGGRLKFLLADRFHRIAERMVAPACSGFLTVSRDYLDDLVRRYGEVCAARPWLVRPFPAEPVEMERVRESIPTVHMRPAPGAARMWRYIGAVAPIC